MKLRTDFVTNSSSSSFIIAKRDLTHNQVRAIRQHSTLAIKLGIYDWSSPEDTDLDSDAWNISENEDFITGFTWMDNFDMDDLFKKIGVPRNVVRWSETPFYLTSSSDDKGADDEKEEWEMMLNEE